MLFSLKEMLNTIMKLTTYPHLSSLNETQWFVQLSHKSFHTKEQFPQINHMDNMANGAMVSNKFCVFW